MLVRKLRPIHAGAIIAVLATGWAVGGLVGVALPAGAGTCDVEPAYFGGSGNNIKYDADSEFEKNQWFLEGGQDFGSSQDCDDIDVSGGGENDEVRGGGHDDNAGGGTGRDTVVGGSGFDDLNGGDADDDLRDNDGVDDSDSLYGNDGDDHLETLDGDPYDDLIGGPENDGCLSNTGDDEASCEHN